VTGYDTMMPYPRIEAAYMPNVDRVLAAVRRTMAYA
jgi:pyruvate/2-oxoglutarate/acetoin dehydrogenase E1 component